MKDDLVPLHIDIKPHFISVKHLFGSWSNIVDTRRDAHNLLQMMIVLGLYLRVFNFVNLFVVLYNILYACEKHLSIPCFYVIYVAIH